MPIQAGSHTLAVWVASGVQPDKQVEANKVACLVDFTVEEGKEFWLAFSNFAVITRYNNSGFYSMSVHQFFDALRDARN